MCQFEINSDGNSIFMIGNLIQNVHTDKNKTLVSSISTIKFVPSYSARVPTLHY